MDKETLGDSENGRHDLPLVKLVEANTVYPEQSLGRRRRSEEDNASLRRWVEDATGVLEGLAAAAVDQTEREYAKLQELFENFNPFVNGRLDSVLVQHHLRKFAKYYFRYYTCTQDANSYGYDYIPAEKDNVGNALGYVELLFRKGLVTPESAEEYRSVVNEIGQQHKDLKEVTDMVSNVLHIRQFEFGR